MARHPRALLAADIEERDARCISAWLALPLWLALAFFTARHLFNLFVGGGFVALSELLLPALVLGVTFLVLPRGFVVLQPNQAAVLTFFGTYTGTIRRAGFWYYNPLASRARISLRVINMTTPTLKVNDADGNPVEIGAVITWKVDDTAKASFSVEAYSEFVTQQAESSIRLVAGAHPYDGDERSSTLRGNQEGIARELRETLAEHVELAGVAVIDVRVAHLAYAAEIAGVMLRRQQAEQVVAAREKIALGALGIVEHTLNALAERNIVALDANARATLVTNLITVLVSESEAQPVLNVGAGGH